MKRQRETDGAPNAGELRNRIEVLRPLVTETGDVMWAVERRVWAKIAYLSKRIPYSTVGVSGDAVKLIVRAISMDKTRCLRWRGSYFAPVALDDSMGRWLSIKAARVHAVDCESDTGRFPAFLTEKWVRYQEEMPYDTNVTTYVLVTPKCVLLQRGSVVSVGTDWFHVRTLHNLEESSNEYEIVRTVDL